MHGLHGTDACTSSLRDYNHVPDRFFRNAWVLGGESTSGCELAEGEVMRADVMDSMVLPLRGVGDGITVSTDSSRSRRLSRVASSKLPIEPTLDFRPSFHHFFFSDEPLLGAMVDV